MRGICGRVHSSPPPPPVTAARASSQIVSLSIAQIRIHGWARCLVGGGTMYLSIPAFIVLNLSIVVLLFQWLLGPLFSLPAVHWRDHVFMDRGRIANLLWLDRLNCQFCGYANGLCTMLNRQLDALAAVNQPVSGWRWALASLAALVSLPLWVLFDLYTIRGLYGLVISRCLRMSRLSLGEGAAILRTENYGGQLPSPARMMLRAWKNSALSLSVLLEQIESAWCPLRHFETRQGIVYPAHHANFFGAHQIEQLREARNHLFANQGTAYKRPRG